MHLNLFYNNIYKYMCGIVGIYNKKTGEVSELIKMLKKLQHRGRDGFGLIKYSNRTYREYRAEGLVEMSEVNQKHDLKVGLGHTRYKTNNVINSFQPIILKSCKLKICFSRFKNSW